MMVRTSCFSIGASGGGKGGANDDNHRKEEGGEREEEKEWSHGGRAFRAGAHSSFLDAVLARQPGHTLLQQFQLGGNFKRRPSEAGRSPHDDNDSPPLLSSADLEGGDGAEPAPHFHSEVARREFGIQPLQSSAIPVASEGTPVLPSSFSDRRRAYQRFKAATETAVESSAGAGGKPGQEGTRGRVAHWGGLLGTRSSSAPGYLRKRPVREEEKAEKEEEKGVDVHGRSDPREAAAPGTARQGGTTTTTTPPPPPRSTRTPSPRTLLQRRLPGAAPGNRSSSPAAAPITPQSRSPPTSSSSSSSSTPSPSYFSGSEKMILSRREFSARRRGEGESSGCGEGGGGRGVVSQLDLKHAREEIGLAGCDQVPGRRPRSRARSRTARPLRTGRPSSSVAI